MKEGSLIVSTKLISQILWDFLYFPIWWYSVGWFRFGKFLYNFLAWQQASLGFWVWVKNIFVPMYGQSDFAGRLISFLMRSVQIVFRGFVLLIIFIIVLSLFVVWPLIPVAIVYSIIYQLI